MTQLNTALRITAMLTLTTSLMACGKAQFNPWVLTPGAPGVPSAAMSQMSVSNPNVADGSTPAVVTITAIDGTNAPVANWQPTIEVSGNQNIIQTCTTTNTNGVAKCMFVSTAAQFKTVSLQNLNISQNTLFVAPPPVRALFAFVSAGDNYSAANHKHTFVSAGIVESANRLLDANGKLRLETSVQATFP